MRKSQTTAFYFCVFIQENLYFVRTDIWKTWFILSYLHYFFFTWQVVGNTVAYRYSLVLQTPYFDPKYLAIDYTSYFNVDFDNNGLFLVFVYCRHVPSIQEKKSILIWEINFIIKSIRKGIEILGKSLLSSFVIVFICT